MLKNKIECSNCGKTIDAFSQKCSFCKQENKRYDEIGLSKHAFNLPFYLQIVFFAFGNVGILVFATILELLIISISGISADAMMEASNIGPLQFAIYGTEFVVFIIMILASKNFLKFIDSFIHYKTYIYGVVGFIAMLIATAFYGRIVELCYSGGENANQNAIIEVATVYPILSLIIFGIIGPLCEELTYRVGLYGLVRRWNKIAAALISAVIFGFIHFDLTPILSFDINGLICELWNLPSYIIAGVGFAIIYERYGFGASFIAHSINNLIGIIEIIVAK